MIIIDPRLGTAADWLKSLDALKVPYEVQTLAFGDVTFAGNGPSGRVQVGIELKKVLDFVNGVHTGRLAGHQLPGLADEYDYAYLCIEGFYRARRGDGLAEVPCGAKWRPLRLGKRPVFWRDLESFLVSVAVQSGVRVQRARTPYETARYIALLYDWFQKPYDEHKTFKTLYAPTSPKIVFERDETRRRLRQAISALIPLVGWERSLDVVKVLPSMDAMVDATEDEWAAIPGIGPKIAGAAVKGLHERIGAGLRARDAGDGAADRDHAAVQRGRRADPRSARPARRRASRRAGPAQSAD